MAKRFDVVRTINNPSLRVVGGSLRRSPIEVDEHLFLLFHIRYVPFDTMHSPYFRLPHDLYMMECPSVLWRDEGR